MRSLLRPSSLLAFGCLAVLALSGSSSLSAVETPTLQNRQSLINATTDETVGNTVGPDDVQRARELAVYVVWGTSATVGVVEVETAHVCTYTGTWAGLATVTFAGTAPKQDIVQITGVHNCIRTRLSTAADGAGVSTYFTGN